MVTATRAADSCTAAGEAKEGKRGQAAGGTRGRGGDAGREGLETLRPVWDYSPVIEDLWVLERERGAGIQ